MTYSDKPKSKPFKFTHEDIDRMYDEAMRGPEESAKPMNLADRIKQKLGEKRA